MGNKLLEKAKRQLDAVELALENPELTTEQIWKLAFMVFVHANRIDRLS